MDEIATIAKKNAIQLEVKKDGLQQRQDGSWSLRLRVHPQDSLGPVSDAPMGQRYVAVLVELNEDETPKERRQWKELTPTVQASIRCGEEKFQEYIGARDADHAAQIVRERCEVQSRRELSLSPRSAAAWEKLDSEFQAHQYGVR